MNYRESHNKKFCRSGFLLKASFVLLTLILAAAVRLPAQIRAFSYEIYRETARVYMNFQTRDLLTLEGDYVRVRYQHKDSDYARIVLETSEKFYHPVADKYRLKSSEKAMVLVYPSKEELNASFGWPASESAMGVYWAGVIRVLSPASWIESKDTEEVRDIFAGVGPMAHELTHLAVDYATRGNCPRWFTEGLAQYEEYKLTGFRFTFREASDEGAFYSLRDMDRGFDDLPDQALAYRESLSAVEYISTVYGEEKLLEIVTALGEGRGMDQSINKVLGIDFATFEQKWRTWSGF
ncbi:MAG: peptidase MA family metallohydrolase [Bacillota bacterium]